MLNQKIKALHSALDACQEAYGFNPSEFFAGEGYSPEATELITTHENIFISLKKEVEKVSSQPVAGVSLYMYVRGVTQDDMDSLLNQSYSSSSDSSVFVDLSDYEDFGESHPLVEKYLEASSVIDANVIQFTL